MNYSSIILIIVMLCIIYLIINQRNYINNKLKFLDKKEKDIVELYDSIEKLLDQVQDVLVNQKFTSPSLDVNTSNSEYGGQVAKKETGRSVFKNEIDRESKLIELRDKGMSVDEIAKELKMGKGEIELILGIDKYKKIL